MNVTELADGGRTAALTNDERISKLLSFIPSYDPSGLVPLGDADLLSLYVEELIGDEEYRLLNLLTGPDGKTIHEELSKQFDELKEVRKAITNPQMRTKDATWDSLDRVLMNFSSTLLRYGKDVYHYGADLASRAVHPTAYYNKGWKLSSFQEGDWEQIVESLDNLSISIYDASVGNMTGSLERSEAAGITLEKLLRGNDVEPLQLKYADAESAPPSSDYSPAIVPSPFAETGATSSLKEMFPFFTYWSEKAEEFVNSEKEVNITMHIGKFFEDMNVTMEDKADTTELEETIIRTFNRALQIGMSQAD